MASLEKIHALALLLACGWLLARAAPQQQQQQVAPLDGDKAPGSPPSSPTQAGPSSPSNLNFDVNPRLADANQQPPAQQATSVAPGQPTAVTLAPAASATTTPSPLRLPTSMPELDFNKELLDYDQQLLAGLQFHPTPQELQQAAAAAAAVPMNSSSAAPTTTQEAYEKWLINRYHDHEQLHNYLSELARAYPETTRLFDLGSSVEGRKLWVLEISERPHEHVPLRPDFRYIANIHGNEPVGRELLLHLARLLLENYHHEEPPEDSMRPTGVKFIKKLVRATRIFLMPTMNPDGFARSDVGCKWESPSMRGRLNANNVNLNRNFPDKVLNTKRDLGTQPEVRALMDWREPFVLSANLHGGAVCVSIPYDGALNTSAKTEDRRAPDHETFMELGRAYSKSHPTMWKGEMCYDKCTEYHQEVFPTDGVTVGAAWYSLYGAMQDWMYDNTNDFHVTLELGCNQYPPAESLQQYWQFNKVALLNYMRQVHRGIKGEIVDSRTLKPLAGVTVHVRSIDHNVTSTPQGDYFRLLSAGHYRVLFEHRDYLPVEISVGLSPTMAQIHNIKMEPRAEAAAQQPQPPAPSGGEPPIETSEHADQASGDNNQHSVAVATLVMSVITLLLLVFLAGAYVIQKRRFSRSKSVSVELQPSGRSATGGGGSGTGLSLPPAGSSSASLSPLKMPGGRGSLSPHTASA